MWQTIRQFVTSVLKLSYQSDHDVAGDPYIQALATEMQSATGAQLSTFPELKTINSLVDAVTMMIHIASPLHTAVNYTQDYYTSFLPNKPTALYAEPPHTLEELRQYKEEDLIAALPVKQPKKWLLATHLPHLLSYRVADNDNLVTYAISLAKTANNEGQFELAKAASKFWFDLISCGEVFARNSGEMDDQTRGYDVLNPKDTAVSILI